MAGNSFNPYWGQAKQYEQKRLQLQQPKPQIIQSQKERRERRARDDYGDEWLNKDVEIECVKGQAVEVIRGRVVDVSRYWIKISVNGQVLYLNKAYVLSIKPAEIESEALGGTNGDRKQ